MRPLLQVKAYLLINFQPKIYNRLNKKKSWLLEGSKILECGDKSRVIVINTDYSTRRGRIIHKILTRQTKRPQFYKKGIYFLLINFAIGVILYLSTLYLLLGNVISLFVGFRFMDILGWTIPPAYPIYFNMAFTFSLIRLKNEKNYRN